MAVRKAALAVPFLLVFFFRPSLSLVNPHDPDDPDRCRSCHADEIQGVKTVGYDPYLLKDSVDEVCLICHKKRDCCIIGQEHLEKLVIGKHTHPSDLSSRKVSRENLPKTLPLQDGKITCNTCHSHDRKESNEYKLLRLVVVNRTGVDWTPLCADCHDTY